MVVVYDVCSGESFANVKRWLHEIDQNCDVVNRILGMLIARLGIHMCHIKIKSDFCTCICD